MNKVVYMSNRLAVFRPGKETSPSQKAVDALLKLNPDRKQYIFERQTEDLIVNFGSRFGAQHAYVGITLYGLPVGDIDQAALSSLGLEARASEYGEAQVWAPVIDGKASPLMLVDLVFVATMAEGLQWLAKLYFCALGDKRVSKFDDFELEAELMQGDDLRNAMINVTAKLPSSLVANTLTRTDRDEFILLTAPSRPRTFMFNCFESGLKPPTTDDDTKKAAASLLFARIVNAPQVQRYRVDAFTFEPEQCNGVSPTDELVIELANLASEEIDPTTHDRALMLCPNAKCNRPIARLGKGKKPFCDGTCQQRYKEQAQEYLRSGASIKEVANKYRYIKGGTETIQAWIR